MSSIDFRDLTSIHELEQVVALEKRIWGYTDGEDVVPVPLLVVTVRRGAVLVGAFDAGDLVGFVYSIPAVHNGRMSQWSHMLGVLPAYRSTGLGYRLKIVQRARALALGVDLIEWTYDPLLALNAHLNFAKLGVVVEEYEENIYGSSRSPMHGVLPTDRFVAQWWIGTPHVERRIAPIGTLPLAAEQARGAVPVNVVRRVGRWDACGDADLSVSADRLLVHVPGAFLEMLQSAPELAIEWRLQTRAIFTTCFARGYRAVDFLFDKQTGRGAYLLAERPLE